MSTVDIWSIAGTVLIIGIIVSASRRLKDDDIPIEQELPDWQCLIVDSLFWIFVCVFIWVVFITLDKAFVPYIQSIIYYIKHGWCC